MFLQDKVHDAQRHGGLVGERRRVLVKIALCLDFIERRIQTEVLRSVQQVVEPVHGFRLRRLLVQATIAVFENGEYAFIADIGVVSVASDPQFVEFSFVVHGAYYSISGGL